MVSPIMFVALAALFAGPAVIDAAGIATFTASPMFDSTKTRDDVYAGKAKAENAVEAWMNQLDIPDNTVSDVSIKTVYNEDNSDLYMEAKFAISSAKDNADAKEKIDTALGKKIDTKQRDAFENEIQKEFAGAKLHEQFGFEGYRLVEGDTTGGKGGVATFTTTAQFLSGTTRDDAFKSEATAKDAVKMWMEQFSIYDNTVSNVDISKDGDKGMKMSAKFTITSQATGADAVDFIESELGKDSIQKEWQEFNKEVKDEFTSIDTDVVDENGFDTYTVVAGYAGEESETEDESTPSATMTTTLTMSATNREYALDKVKEVKEAITAWMDDVKDVTVTDVSIKKGSEDTDLVVAVAAEIAGVKTDDGAKNAVENYFSTTPASTKAVSATIRNDLNSEIENKTGASDVVTAMSDPEIQAGNTISSATALRLTGMAVLGAFLCGNLLL